MKALSGAQCFFLTVGRQHTQAWRGRGRKGERKKLRFQHPAQAWGPDVQTDLTIMRWRPEPKSGAGCLMSEPPRCPTVAMIFLKFKGALEPRILKTAITGCFEGLKVLAYGKFPAWTLVAGGHSVTLGFSQTFRHNFYQNICSHVFVDYPMRLKWIVRKKIRNPII